MKRYKPDSVIEYPDTKKSKITNYKCLVHNNNINICNIYDCNGKVKLLVNNIDKNIYFS